MRKESDQAVVKGLPYIVAFQKLEKVVAACFGVTLVAGYKQTIKEFQDQYMSLGVSVSPKLHIIFQHIGEFLDLVNEKREGFPVGLGFFSEQAFEAVHADVKKNWERVKVSPNHPEFGEKLKSFIVAYNARHI